MENVELTGAQDAPSSEASQETAPPSAIDYAKLAEALKPYVEQQWQSGKDKRIAGLQGKVDSFEARLAKYLEMTGLKPDHEVLRNMRIDELLDQVQPTIPNTGAAAQTGGGSQAAQPSVDSETLTAMNLDPNSPDVTELLRKGASLKEYVALANKSKVKTASPSTVMSSGSGAAVTSDLDSITEELNVLYKNPVKNASKINELLKKAAALS